jgi:hypothetical protein
MNKIKLFNNEVEIGLRILVILKCIYPKSLDVEMINYYDYFSLHTNDIEKEESLHADVPNRSGELSVKIELIHNALRFLISKRLIEIKYTDNGIEYIAGENVSPFLDNLNENYTLSLDSKVKCVCHYFKECSNQDIRKFVLENKSKWGNETTFCTIGLLDE